MSNCESIDMSMCDREQNFMCTFMKTFVSFHWRSKGKKIPLATTRLFRTVCNQFNSKQINNKIMELQNFR